MRNQLGEDGASDVHPPLFRGRGSPSFRAQWPEEFQIVPVPDDCTLFAQQDLLRSLKKWVFGGIRG
jgi:hypothetical protein